MNSPLIEKLLSDGFATEVDLSSLDSFLSRRSHTLLFFTGDLKRFPESNDLAVILPELQKSFAGQFQIGLVAASDQQALQRQYGFNHWPTLVMLKGEEYLGAISKLQDWATYRAEIEALLQTQPKLAQGFFLPVIDQSGQCY